MKSDLISISKFLSLVLRHKPETIGIKLSPEGWINVETLLAAMQESGKSISKKLLDEVVFTNDKQRFTYSQDGLSIRANQGHSIKIDLALKAVTPPNILFHGTAQKNMGHIRELGLLKQSRHHVHLSPSKETAYNVGKRHGKPIILEINALDMMRDGFLFYLSKNNVWLTEHVPVKYIHEVKSSNLI